MSQYLTTLCTWIHLWPVKLTLDSSPYKNTSQDARTQVKGMNFTEVTWCSHVDYIIACYKLHHINYAGCTRSVCVCACVHVQRKQTGLLLTWGRVFLCSWHKQRDVTVLFIAVLWCNQHGADQSSDFHRVHSFYLPVLWLFSYMQAGTHTHSHNGCTFTLMLYLSMVPPHHSQPILQVLLCVTRCCYT